MTGAAASPASSVTTGDRGSAVKTSWTQPTVAEPMSRERPSNGSGPSERTAERQRRAAARPRKSPAPAARAQGAARMAAREARRALLAARRGFAAAAGGLALTERRVEEPDAFGPPAARGFRGAGAFLSGSARSVRSTSPSSETGRSATMPPCVRARTTPCAEP